VLFSQLKRGKRPVKRVFQHAAAALTLGLSLVVGSATVSSATPIGADQSASGNAAATCPAQGHRIKTSSDSTVYLIGPSNVLYNFEDSVEYFALYSSYSGIMTVSGDVFDACLQQSPGGTWPLPYAELEKLNGTSKVYIYDAYHGGDRWITSQSVFDRYGFDASKIQGTPGLSRVGPDWS
jgi:hypothetical protein